MTDRQTTILESIETGDFHQAEMFIKSGVSRLAKDKKYDDINTLLKAVLNKLASKQKNLIKEVRIISLEWKHGYRST